MSMDSPGSSHDVRDMDMSEATTDDPKLAPGEPLYSMEQFYCLWIGGCIFCFIYGKELDETIQCSNLFLYSFMLSAWSLLLAALQLPMQDSSRDSSSQMDISKLLANQSFVSSILASVCLLQFANYYFHLYPATKWENISLWWYLISSLFLQLPGVDPNNPSVKDLLASMQSQSKVNSLNFQVNIFL